MATPRTCWNRSFVKRVYPLIAYSNSKPECMFRLNFGKTDWFGYLIRDYTIKLIPLFNKLSTLEYYIPKSSPIAGAGAWRTVDSGHCALDWTDLFVFLSLLLTVFSALSTFTWQLLNSVLCCLFKPCRRSRCQVRLRWRYRWFAKRFLFENSMLVVTSLWLMVLPLFHHIAMRVKTPMVHQLWPCFIVDKD